MGTTFPAGHITGPGICNHDTIGATTIGPFKDKPASQEESDRLAEALTRSGMETISLEDPRGPMWTKVIFNIASNATGALTKLPHGVACDQEGVRKLMTALVDECKAVAAKLGISPDSDPDKLIDYGRDKAYYHKASMLQDVLAQRVTEVDSLNGAIAQLGKKVGVPTPLNEAFTTLVKGVEHSWTLND